jgi:hypothetical protein
MSELIFFYRDLILKLLDFYLKDPKENNLEIFTWYN